MPIPHTVRSVAREAYRPFMYTGRAFDNIGKNMVRVGRINVVVIDESGKQHIVPIAKSWI